MLVTESFLIQSITKLLTVSPSNNHPKLPWRAESSSVGCVMQTITAKVYCIGLTETYCANLASRSSEEPWGSVEQPGSVVSGSFHPPASTFYRFNNLGWLCSIKGCSEAVTINHQAYWNCFFFLQIIDGKSHNNNFPGTKMIKENGLVVMVTSFFDLYF